MFGDFDGFDDGKRLVAEDGSGGAELLDDEFALDRDGVGMGYDEAGGGFGGGETALD